MESPGRRFVEAIAARSPGALADSLAPDVDFKALTPRRFWEAATPDEVLDIVLGTWFEEQDRITGRLPPALSNRDVMRTEPSMAPSV